MFLKKQIFQLSVLKKLLTTEDSCVTLVPTTRLLLLPPCFLNNIKKGIFFILNKGLKKYDQNLDGILIGYQNVKILMDDRTGLIPMGIADLTVNISIEFYVFRPKVGGYLQGIVNKKSNSHIGCLVHKYFNASILKPDDIEFDEWECKDIDVEDHIKFRVVDLDFTCYIPIIEGIIDQNNSSCLRKEAVSNLVGDIVPKDYEFEKKLLKSEDFWIKKLNKKKWVPELNLEESDTKSRKRTFSNVTSSSTASGSENEDKEDLYFPKKKKPRKNSEAIKNEQKLNDEIPLQQNEQCTNEANQSKKKIDDIVDCITNVTTDPLLSLHGSSEKLNDNENSNGKKNKKSRSLSKRDKMDDLKSEMDSTDSTALFVSKNKNLHHNDTNQFQKSTGKKNRLKKRKHENTSDLETTPKFFESTPLTTKLKKVSHIADKQSESDSGVGLEPKESLHSPILFQMSSVKKTKRKSEPQCLSDKLISPNTKVLHMSLIEEAKKKFILEEQGDEILGKKLNSKVEVNFNSKSASEKNNRELLNVNSKKQNHSRVIENLTPSKNMKSVSRQILKKMEDDDSAEEKLFKTLKKNSKEISLKVKDKTPSSSKNKAISKIQNESREINSSNYQDTIFDSKNDGDASFGETDHEKLIERLKQEEIESLLPEDKQEDSKLNSKKNKKRKKKKKKPGQKEKKEKTVTDNNLDSLCAKLLQDALININGIVEDKDGPTITTELLSKQQKKKKKKKKEEKSSRKRKNSLEKSFDAKATEGHKKKSKKEKINVERDFSCLTFSPRNSDADSKPSKKEMKKKKREKKPK